MPGTRRSGRKPTPTALKIARGNPGKRRLPDKEPRSTVKLPRPPAELSPAAKKEWNRLGRELVRSGIITVLDRNAFAAMVVSYCTWMEAQEAVVKTGLLVRAADGIARVNPLLRVAREAQADFTRMLGEFGLTPASRVRVTSLAPDEPDEFEKLLTRSGF